MAPSEDNAKAVFPTAFLPPIQYFRVMSKYKSILIEKHETFPKQTIRNRCYIYTANGIQLLSIPLKERKNNSQTKDIKISHDTNWSKIHLKTIESAYNNSPFYEYYNDKLISIYDLKQDFLLDFNNSLMNWLLEVLETEVKIKYTGLFKKKYANETADYRNYFNTKDKTFFSLKNISDKNYRQVFEEKYNFIPNLSIIDLIFNAGPDAGNFIL
ncbi:MAG: WbqC family protein [Bacteroidales bacterium]|nr:WbqC family protein [Bacteroidales bacterium]